MTNGASPPDPMSGTPPSPSSGPDTPPPAPPHELEPDAVVPLVFDAAGEQWLARLAGKGAAGTGGYGLGMLDALHFCRADQPETPLREVLLERGRFRGLFDDELRSLLAKSRPIMNVETRPDAGQGGHR